ncbi:MAG: HAD family hydrolase [Spirochaetales bacterium]|nr:HAD family hydrolase [Spirochaetales bacterium]
MKLSPDKIRAILFDIDGTLFSSESIIHEIYQQEFRRHRKLHGVPAEIPSLESIVAQIGKPVVEIFAALAPDLAISARQQISGRILRALVHDIESGKGLHYPGGLLTVRTLHQAGIKLHAASNGRKEYIEAILRSAGMEGSFAPIRAVDGLEIHNKDELVATILRENNLLPGQCLLIGDRESDRQAAEKNRIPFIACSFGHGDAREHRGAVAVLRELPELLDLFDLSARAESTGQDRPEAVP